MNELSTVQQFTVWVLPVLFAITLHEVAHGWVALRFGDSTAKAEGRLTLNPLKHIDLIGTILVPSLLFLTGGILFGWAKPVPVTWQYLRNPKRDMAFVALAGPLANLAMACAWGLIGKLGVFLAPLVGMPGIALVYMGEAGIIINVLLMIFNLLPIPPLDGSRIVSSILPARLAWQYNKLEPYGFFILLALIFTGAVNTLIGQPVHLLRGMLSNLFGI